MCVGRCGKLTIEGLCKAPSWILKIADHGRSFRCVGYPCFEWLLKTGSLTLLLCSVSTLSPTTYSLGHDTLPSYYHLSYSLECKTSDNARVTIFRTVWNLIECLGIRTPQQMTQHVHCSARWHTRHFNTKDVMLETDGPSVILLLDDPSRPGSILASNKTSSFTFDNGVYHFASAFIVQTPTVT